MDLNQKAIIWLYHGYVLCWSRFIENSNHSHHAIQIVIGLKNEFEVFSDGFGNSFESVIIAPNVSHRLVSSDSNVLLLLIDNEMEIAKRMSSKYFKNRYVNSIDFPATRKEKDKIISQLEVASCQAGQFIWTKIIRMLLGPDTNPSHQIDPRIKKALGIIAKLPLKKISTSDLASQVFISESRFLHLFKDNVGIPVRRYLLWMRLNEAVKKILHNVSLTDAAHEAGFSDSAHLSRTFRSMFGLTLSEILKNNRHVQIISCMD
jgi:AraC-like DNA-binding protein